MFSATQFKNVGLILKRVASADAGFYGHKNVRLSSSPNYDRYEGGRNLRLGNHVKLAIANNEPIVALESTVITHGMPEPENRKLALELEQIVRNQGSVPATIGIINGQLVIGLNQDEIEFLSQRQLSKPMKASRRDIPIAIALKKSAGTTVACTMSIACSLAKEASSSGPIKVFATGGTGGVHKGGELSMDISADLFEFSRSPIGVVSSGFKSFLDSRRSLEYLETIGCTVMSLQCENHASDSKRMSQLFPAFYSSENDEQIESPLGVQSIEEAARILHECLESSSLGPLSRKDCRGALLAVPIPRQHSLDNLGEKLREAVQLIDSRQDLQGHEKTPLILAKLNEITNGQSLTANLELLKNNARVGGQLAREYQLVKAEKCDNAHNIDTNAQSHDSSINELRNGDKLRPLVIGCTMVDMHVSTKMDEAFRNNERFSGVTFAGRPHLSVGGVGRNLAVALEYLGCAPRFVTAISDDSLGQFAIDNLNKVGLTNGTEHASLIRVQDEIGKCKHKWKSSCFALVLRDSLTGQCEYVIANLDTINSIGKNEITKQRDMIANAPLVILDANLGEEAIETSIELCSHLSKPIFIEPTDCLAIPRLTKCLKFLDSKDTNFLSSVVCLSPNLIEFQMMVKNFSLSQADTDKSSGIDSIAQLGCKIMQEHLIWLKCLMITMDKDGVLVISRIPLDSNGSDLLNVRNKTNSHLYSHHYAVPEQIDAAVSGSGAGDSFAAGFIASLIRQSQQSSSASFTLHQCIEFGFRSARLALMDEDTIPKTLITLRNDLIANKNQ